MERIREVRNCLRFVTALFAVLMLASMWLSARGLGGEDYPLAPFAGVVCAIISGWCYGASAGLNDQLKMAKARKEAEANALFDEVERKSKSGE